MLQASWQHYIDVIMTTMASQITSFTVVYSTVYSDADQRKHQSSASLAFVWGIHRTGDFPAQKASYAENVSIWWRHHGYAAVATTVHSAGCLKVTVVECMLQNMGFECSMSSNLHFLIFFREIFTIRILWCWTIGIQYTQRRIWT